MLNAEPPSAPSVVYLSRNNYFTSPRKSDPTSSPFLLSTHSPSIINYDHHHDDDNDDDNNDDDHDADNDDDDDDDNDDDDNDDDNDDYNNDDNDDDDNDNKMTMTMIVVTMMKE